MTYQEFVQLVQHNMHETIYEDSEGRSILIIDLLDAYAMANKLSEKRTWVGLTDEEIKDCFKITPDQHLPWHIYQRIEAKLKEKNSA